MYLDGMTDAQIAAQVATGDTAMIETFVADVDQTSPVVKIDNFMGFGSTDPS